VISVMDAADDSVAQAGAATVDADPTGDQRRWRGRGRDAVVASVVTAMSLASLFHVETRAADFDPQYARNIVERTARFGGSYYENGIHNKGPLEPALYSLAARISSYDGFWFAIALFVMLASTVAGLAARRVVTICGGPAWLAWSSFAAVYIHLTLSGADYAGVLYSRNMTVSLLSVAFLSIATTNGDRSPRGRLALLVVAGGSIGLAVQTLQTAALTGLVMVAFAVFGRQAGSPRTNRERLWFLGSGAVVFLSAPAYYAAFGPWRDFWDGWWVYGRYMTAATDRGVRDQLGLGWHEFYLWANSHAPAMIVICVFVLMGIARWRHLPAAVRSLHVLLPAWWAAGWFEIILTQRYSSHYFVVVAVPAALMAVGAAWHLVDLLTVSGARVPGRGSVSASLLTVAIVMVSITWSGASPVIDGLERASEFRGVETLARNRAQGRDGSARSVQAVLDLVSEPGDPMLAWTNVPWPYLDFHRVSATRFIWKSFLMGEVYLGRTSTEFVIPGSWERWQADVEMTRPPTFLVDKDFPVPADTPAGTLLADEFQMALVTPTLSVAVRPRILRTLADPPAGADAWEPAEPAGQEWTFEGGDVAFDAGGADPGGLRATIGDMRCRRWDAVIDQGGVSFHFDDPSGRSENLEISVHDGVAVSRSPNVEFLRTQLASDAHRVTLIAGTSSAVLIVDDAVVGALSLVSAEHVTLAALDDATALSSTSTSAAPTLGECAAG
jgi:hypothetical protein